MVKKILVVAESIDINSSSGPKANMTMIHNLQLAGFELRVLHTSNKNIVIKGIATKLVNANRFSVLNFLAKLQRYLTKIIGVKLHRTVEGIFGFSFAFFNDTNAIIRGVKDALVFQPDMIFTVSQGASFRPHYALLKMPELHSKWVAYIHDPYPFHCYPPPYNWYQPGYKKKEAFFKSLSESARYAAFPSKLLLEWMGKTFPEFFKRGIVIPHQLPDPSDITIVNQTFLNEMHFNLLYAGNISIHRNPIGLLEGYMQFLNEFPEAKRNTRLLFVGSSDDFATVIESYANKIEGIKLINQHLPFGEVLQLQHLTSVNIILESKSTISPFLPGKFPHCVDANKKILLLGPDLSESHRLLGSDYPYWSEADDSLKIKNIIRNLYSEWSIDASSVLLQRPDLKAYCSGTRLKTTIESLSFS